jgi:predicted transcriptional regulator
MIKHIALIIIGILLGIFYDIIFLLLIIYLFKKLTIYLFGNKKETSIINYFLKRQVGSIEDIIKETNLDEDTVAEHIKKLAANNKIILILNDPELYQWMENRVYPEGMISREIKL